MICFIRSLILSNLALPAHVTFLALILMVRQLFHPLCYWINFLTMPLRNQAVYTTYYMYLGQAMLILCKLSAQNLPMITVPGYFLIIICCEQLNFIITYVLFTNKISISNFISLYITRPKNFDNLHKLQIFFPQGLQSIAMTHKFSIFAVAFRINIESDVFVDIRNHKMKTTENFSAVSIKCCICKLLTCIADTQMTLSI